MIRSARLAFLAVAFALTACSTSQHIEISDYPPHEEIRIAAVGDSITYGAGVENRQQNSYPAVLDQMLGERFDVENFGISGYTLLKKGDLPYWNYIGRVDNFNPHAVVIMLGTNDTKPHNWEHVEEFDDDLRDMIHHFQDLPAEPRVWVALPPSVYKDNFGIAEAGVVAEQQIIRRVAEEEGVAVIDAYRPFKGRGDLFVEDGVHPNAAGARVLAQTVRDALIGEQE